MNNTPLKAIKQFCYECCGENRSEVKRCTSILLSAQTVQTGKKSLYKSQEFERRTKRVGKAETRRCEK